jgi:branched-chain amino acid transport system permease protein
LDVPDVTTTFWQPLRWVGLVTGIAAAVACGFLPSYYTGLLIEGLVFSIFALGLNLLLGYTGLPSLGHAAYFAAGAYAAGLIAVKVTPDFWAGLACGLAVSIALGAVFGLLALRTSGVYFLMITLALAQVAWGVVFSWRDLTGGDDGLRSIPRPALAIPGIDLSGTTAFYEFTLAAFVIALVLMRAILRSPFGHSLRGVKDSEARMDALGYNVWLHKYIAFVLSAGFSGFAGVLLAYYRGFVSPEAASIIVSAEVMLMVILGGAATLVGPVVGAFFIILLSNFISAYTARWTLILGALYAIVVLLAPAGVVGEVLATRKRWRGGEP